MNGSMTRAEARVERTGERVIVSECKTTLGTWWILGGLGVVAGGGSGGSGFGYSLSGAGFGYAITGFLTGFIIAGRDTCLGAMTLSSLYFATCSFRTLCGFCEPARQVAAQPSKQQ